MKNALFCSPLKAGKRCPAHVNSTFTTHKTFVHVPLLFTDPHSKDSTRFGSRHKQSCRNGCSLLLLR